MERVSRSKYMIDYKNKVRECGTCGDVKPFSLFSVYPDGLTYTDCKVCRSDKATRKYGDKMLKAYPDLYNQCSNEECNWIWAKRKGQSCTKCGSPAIVPELELMEEY